MPLLTLLEYGCLHNVASPGGLRVVLFWCFRPTSTVRTTAHKTENKKISNFQDVYHEETALNCSFSDILIQMYDAVQFVNRTCVHRAAILYENSVARARSWILI